MVETVANRREDQTNSVSSTKDHQQIKEHSKAGGAWIAS
jgi:hypothetical protein